MLACVSCGLLSTHCRIALQAKAAKLVDLLKVAKHAVIFSGAGISTAAGIGDYRGLTGAWTLQELAYVPAFSGVI